MDDPRRKPKYCLYDTERHWINDLPAERGDLIWQMKGLYDYDRDIFIIPQGMRFPESEWKVIKTVGYEFRLPKKK